LTYLASLSEATNLTLSTTHEGCMCYNTNQNIYVALFRYSESAEAQLKVLTKESDFRPRCAPSTQISVRRWPPRPPLVSTTESRPPWPSLVSTTQSRPQRSPLVLTTQPLVPTTQSSASFGLNDPTFGLNDPILASMASSLISKLSKWIQSRPPLVSTIPISASTAFNKIIVKGLVHHDPLTKLS
jgi:hypothetical protein